MKTIVVCILTMLLSFICCDLSAQNIKKSNAQRLLELVKDTSSLTEKDDDEALRLLDALVEQYRPMSKEQRNAFLGTKEGDVFAEAFMDAMFYIGEKYKNGGKVTDIKPLTNEQKVKFDSIRKKIKDDNLFMGD